jgi:hypothetical protein
MKGAPPAVPAALPPKSTNPTSTKCTVRSPCPIAPAAQPRANPRPTTSPKAPAARFSSQPTRANPAPNSAPPRAPPAARPGTGVGGRSDRSRRQTSASSAIPSVKSKSRCWDPPACCSAPSPAHCCGNATASPAALLGAVAGRVLCLTGDQQIALTICNPICMSVLCVSLFPSPKRQNFSAFMPTLCVVGNAKAKSSRRTSGNLRRYDIADIRRDLIHAAPTASRKTVAYARVSSHDQKEDLERQKQVLESYCAA